MNVTYEAGVPVSVNGKAVKPASKRGWKKAMQTSYFQLFSGEYYPTENPYSGVQVVLNGLEATIYAWCTEWYRRYSFNLFTQAPVQTYDDMKYFLLEINPDAYMDLID